MAWADNDFNFTTVDGGSEITYTPWTDGHAVGFKVTQPNGDESYVYLNPSQTDGGPDSTPDVFVIQGVTGESDQDMAQVWISTAPEDCGG